MVFACVAPTLLDQTMTLNTLRYVGPIKTGSHNLKKVEPDVRNPSNWDNARLRTWFLETFPNLKINLDLLCPFESGKQILRLPEADFILRITKGNPKIAEKTAKSVYDKLWAKLVDARTRERRRKVKKVLIVLNNSNIPNAISWYIMFPHIEKKGEGKSGKDELGPSLRSKGNSGGREQSFRPYIHQRKYLQIKLWNMSTNVPVKLKCLNISDFVTSAYSIYLCHLKLIQSMHSVPPEL